MYETKDKNTRVLVRDDMSAQAPWLNLYEHQGYLRTLELFNASQGDRFRPGSGRPLRLRFEGPEAHVAAQAVEARLNSAAHPQSVREALSIERLTGYPGAVTEAVFAYEKARFYGVRAKDARREDEKLGKATGARFPRGLSSSRRLA